MRNRTSLVGAFGALLAVGALGATAGMMAKHWAQRHRAQRTSYYRDLSRWEDEGGALATNGSGGSAVVAFSADRPGTASDTAHRGDGAAGEPWPFPHGHA
ncbi:hypothetical protein [Paraburkholderia adhaesiva]|uniref:hypothetical protein n=1 Tax=Paraburkholderia adhaesiva TaxID=2883244 RepID=UPI001F17E900|nr:hypothetical protein [Paraburkholderia adhaesiva]